MHRFAGLRVAGCTPCWPAWRSLCCPKPTPPSDSWPGDVLSSAAHWYDPVCASNYRWLLWLHCFSQLVPHTMNPKKLYSGRRTITVLFKKCAPFTAGTVLFDSTGQSRGRETACPQPPHLSCCQVTTTVNTYKRHGSTKCKLWCLI